MTDQFIPHHGLVLEIRPDNWTDYQLEELHAYVGGYIEVVEIDADTIMVVDEEGLLRPSSAIHNPRASEIAGKYIVGNVVVMERSHLQ